MRSGVVDGGSDRPFGVGSREGGVAQRREDCGVALILGCGFVGLKATGELVGVVEDVLNGAWYVDHLRNLSRAFIA